MSHPSMQEQLHILQQRQLSRVFGHSCLCILRSSSTWHGQAGSTCLAHLASTREQLHSQLPAVVATLVVCMAGLPVFDDTSCIHACCCCCTFSAACSCTQGLPRLSYVCCCIVYTCMLLLLLLMHVLHSSSIPLLWDPLSSTSCLQCAAQQSRASCLNPRHVAVRYSDGWVARQHPVCRLNVGFCMPAHGAPAHPQLLAPEWLP